MIVPGLESAWETLFLMDIIILFLLAGLIQATFMQWVNHKQEKSRADFVLGFAVFSFAILVEQIIFFVRRYFLDVTLFDPLYQVAIGFFLVGGLFFTFCVEREFGQFLHTHYLVTIVGGAVIISLFSFPSVEMKASILPIASAIVAAVPVATLAYLFHKSSGRSRRQFIYIAIGAVSLVLLVITTTDRGFDTIVAIASNPAMILIEFKVACFILLPLFTFGFTGSPLLLEISWRNNLIAFYLVELSSIRLVYEHSFRKNNTPDLQDQDSSALKNIAGGIRGMMEVVEMVSQSPGRVVTVDQEDKKLLICCGQNLAGVFIVNRSVGNMQYFLSKIVQHAEIVYNIDPGLFKTKNEVVLKHVIQHVIGTTLEAISSNA